jgi:hypothetical protein
MLFDDDSLGNNPTLVPLLVVQEASRGWFEDDASFDARVKAIRATFTAKLHQKPKAKKAPGSYAAAVTSNITAAGRIDKWAIPGQHQGSKNNAWGAAAGSKKAKAKNSDVFSLMMAKSEEEEEEEDKVENEDSDWELEPISSSSSKQAPKPGQQHAKTDIPQNNNDTTNTAKSKKKSKKSKGGKKKQKDEADMSEDEILETALAANAAARKAKEDKQEVLHPAIAFIQNYLIPFVLGFIAFLVSLFFGKPKQKQKKR